MDKDRTLGFSIDLKKKVSDLTEKETLEVQTLLEKHGVICIKNQDLSSEDLLKWVRKLGKPMDLPPGLAFDNQENQYITRIGNIKKDGSIIQN